MKSSGRHIDISFGKRKRFASRRRAGADESTKVEIAAQPHALSTTFALRTVLALAFAVCAAAAVFSMLELPVEPYLFAVALGVAAIEVLVSLKPPLMRGANIAFAVVAVIVCVMRPGWLYEGLPLACNQAMKASSAHQAYEYDLFAIGLPAEAEATALAVGLGFVVAIALAIAAGSIMNGQLAPLFLLMVLFVAAQCYWGIAPYSWTTVGFAVIIAASLALASPVFQSPGGLDCRSASGVLAAMLVAVVAIGVLAAMTVSVYPRVYWDGNPSVAQMNESMRDAAAGGESIVEAIANGLSDAADRGSVSGTEAQGDNDQNAEDYSDEARSSTSQRATPLPLWAYLVVMALAALAICAICYLVSRYRVRRRFVSPDPRVAGNALFRNAMRRLRLLGLAPANRGFRDFESQVAGLFGNEAAAPFRRLVDQWQQLRYSSMPATANDAKAIRSSYDELVGQLCQSRRVNLGMRIKAALLCYTRN